VKRVAITVCLLVTVAAAVFDASASADSADNNGTALSILLGSSSCQAGSVFHLTGTLVTSGSTTPVGVFLSLESAPMVQVAQITDFVGDSRYKVADFVFSFPVFPLPSVGVLSFVQSGSDGRATKSTSTFFDC
jgi:hypothetical protein